MKNIMKKVMIYSMVGMMQVGLCATVIEASPLHYDGPQRIMQLDDRHDYNNDRQRRHDERLRMERERHERERHERERRNEQEWHDRQERENQRHDNTMNEIAAGVIGYLIGSASK